MAELTLSELKSRLSAEQLKAADLLVANDYELKKKRSYDDVAADLGISVRTLYNYRQDPNLIKYCAYISETKLDSFTPTVDAKLMELIENGASNNGIAPIKALELFYKLNGRLVERREVVQTEEGTAKRITDDELQRGLDELDAMLQ